MSGAPCFDCATVKPSNPILISTMSLTPFFWQSSNSLFFIARDALVASGWLSPTPAQNSFMPPPVPVELDDRGLHAGGLAELLGDRGGEGIDGRRSDDADLVAGFGVAGKQYAGRRKRKCAGECGDLHASLLFW